MALDAATWPRVGVGALIRRGDAILLLRRLRAPEAGSWGIPGGKVDPFEPAAEAVRREVEEETGLRLGDLDLLCVSDLIDREAGHHWICPAYLADAFEGEATLREPTKHGAIGWFDRHALPQPLTAATVAALAALQARERQGT